MSLSEQRLDLFDPESAPRRVVRKVKWVHYRYRVPWELVLALDKPSLRDDGSLWVEVLPEEPEEFHQALERRVDC